MRALVIGVCTLLAATPALAQPAPCRLPRLAKVEITADKNGALLVPVTINGATEYFNLNGNPWSFVYEADADRLGFGSHHHERDDGMFFGVNQVTTRRTAELIEGKVRWKEFEFYERPGPKPEGKTAIGSLGLDFLESAALDVEVNIAAGEINFIQAGACAAPPWATSGGLPLETGEGAMLPLTLDGHPMRGLINSEIDASMLDVSALPQFKLAPDSPGMRPGALTASDGTPLTGYTFRSLDIGEASLTAPSLVIMQRHDAEADEALHRRLASLNPYAFAPPIHRVEPFDVVWLGRAELQRLRLYFMFHAHKVFVTPVPGAPNTARVAAPQLPPPDVGQ
jgi:hypothetical protein